MMFYNIMYSTSIYMSISYGTDLSENTIRHAKKAAAEKKASLKCR